MFGLNRVSFQIITLTLVLTGTIKLLHMHLHIQHSSWYSHGRAKAVCRHGDESSWINVTENYTLSRHTGIQGRSGVSASRPEVITYRYPKERLQQVQCNRSFPWGLSTEPFRHWEEGTMGIVCQIRSCYKHNPMNGDRLCSTVSGFIAFKIIVRCLENSTFDQSQGMYVHSKSFILLHHLHQQR